MQVALDALVYLAVGLISLGLLLTLAKSISPTPMAELDEEGLARAALECYAHSQCGTYKVRVENISRVEELLSRYHVPYSIEWEGGEVVYVERSGGEVVIHG